MTSVQLFIVLYIVDIFITFCLCNNTDVWKVSQHYKGSDKWNNLGVQRKSSF